MNNHLPLRNYKGTPRVHFANNGGGFDLRGAPDGVEMAAFIVKAVNSHDTLVAALRKFANLDKSVASDLWAIRADWCEEARAALAAAEAA